MQRAVVSLADIMIQLVQARHSKLSDTE